MGAERANRQARDDASTDHTDTGPSLHDLAGAASSRTGVTSSVSGAEVDMAAVIGASAGRVRPHGVQPKLEVGAVDDPFEREADAMADAVMGDLAPGASSFAPPQMGRVARQSEVGADGGVVSDDLARSITGSVGSSMPAELRTRMESGFGTDLSAVRLHTESPAASRIQARAFTQSNDVHFAPGQYQPDSPGGQHLIAHELAHVVQQTGGVNRLMWEQARFDTETSQAWTTKSTAQKDIRTQLVDYHSRFPFGDLDEGKAAAAFDAVTRMKIVADAYIAKNVKSVEGQDLERSSRSDRIAGMRAFSQTCAGELSWLTGRINRGKDAQDAFDSGAATQRVSEEAGVKKITDHYTGDAVSCFRKLGGLIEAAAPAAGDSAGISLEVQIPAAPGVTVNLGFGAEVSRDDAEDNYVQAVPGKPPPAPKVSPVEIGLNVYAGAGGNVGPAASVAGALGLYMKSRAQTGADAAELLSYALFRRARSSSLVPREVTNLMWGEGNADAFGWQVAEAWSLGVEKRILDSMGPNADGDETNENFVETGGLGKASAEIGIDKVAKFEVEAEGYVGTRIDATSLQARKGGAGAANKTSGSALRGGGRNMTKQSDVRGTTQKNVGRTTRGFKLSAAAGNDMLSGGLEFAMQWISGTKKPMDATLGGNFSFTMPGDEIIGGGIGNMIPSLVEFVNRMISSASARAAQEEGMTPRTMGNVGHSLETAATSVAGLAKAQDIWKPPTQIAEDSGGFGSSTTYTISLEFDLLGPELTITISQDKTSEVAKLAEDISKTSSGAAGVKLEMSKSSRLLSITIGGGAPEVKWAGSTG